MQNKFRKYSVTFWLNTERMVQHVMNKGDNPSIMEKLSTVYPGKTITLIKVMPMAGTYIRP